MRNGKRNLRPTMANVAEKAGVSISTVSLVLNQKPGVSAEVREIVQDAIEELGYQGKGNRSDHKREIGGAAQTTYHLTVIHYGSPDINYPFEQSKLFVDYVTTIQEQAQELNLNWSLISNFREGDPTNLSYQLLNGRGDGPHGGYIIMGIPSPDSPFLRQLIEDRQEIVVLSRDWPLLPVSSVSQNYVEQATLALEHLIDLGHKEIAFVAREIDQEFDWFDIRLNCYKRFMRQLGKPHDPDLIAIGKTGGEAAAELMRKRPDVTGMFAIHDENAASAIEALQHAGYRVPQDISIIGLDNSAELPQGNPGITTVAFPQHKMAELAVKTLIEQLDDEQLRYSKLFVRSHLIERDSCAPPRVKEKA